MYTCTVMCVYTYVYGICELSEDSTETFWEKRGLPQGNLRAPKLEVLDMLFSECILQEVGLHYGSPNWVNL